ncbi:phosphonate transport system permease protein [Geomicrobium halophilum]|uniref:Phosphonate transport system permease protein n=1 Tax=Geomicrobium halophilum TaxID=549000 RepID=A0A841PME0_9BACL|nr:phosphonate ABC transporter, permease protein PhnE [Geomicrobium halophilum]MBB6449920.1 phosphonate transport system permease protein [Geomicrobium halophilum]
MSRSVEGTLEQPLELPPRTENKDLLGLYKDWQRRKKMVRKNRAWILGIIFLAVVWSWYATEFTLLYLISGAGNIAAFIATDLFPPDLSSIPMFIGPALETLYMSYAGMVISVAISLILAFLIARNMKFHPIISFICRSIVTFLRAVPALVWGIILVSAIGLGPFAGMVAVALSGVGILGKAFSDIVEEIDMDQVGAVKATGANWFQVVGQSVWPQFKSGFVGWSLYKLDLNIREAAVLGMVGAGGIGIVLERSISLFQYQEAAMGILMIFALILLVEFTTAKIRERIL